MATTTSALEPSFFCGPALHVNRRFPWLPLGASPGAPTRHHPTAGRMEGIYRQRLVTMEGIYRQRLVTMEGTSTQGVS